MLLGKSIFVSLKKYLIMDVTAEEKRTVSFFTNCYENDWEEVLISNRLEEMIKQCDFDFSERVLIINNVSDKNRVEKFAAEAVEKKIIDAYHFSEDYSAQILAEFGISRSSFKLDFYDGYWYSMGPLCAILLCKSKYLLYFTCDCMMDKTSNPAWIDKAAALLEEDQTIFVANPVWDSKYEEAKKESYHEDADWYYGHGFSDQSFLIENSRYYGNIYNHYHISSEVYPIQAGNLFEGRVNSYMRVNKLQRITSKHASYTHIKLLNKGISAEPKKKSFFVKIREKLSRRSRRVRVRKNNKKNS